MSSRERWTVYPLLFLTLGITLKDKVTREISTDRVNCKQLLVTDRLGHPQLALSPTPTGGLVDIRSRNGQGLLLGHAAPWFGLMFMGPNGPIPTALSLPMRTQKQVRPGTHEPE